MQTAVIHPDMSTTKSITTGLFTCEKVSWVYIRYKMVSVTHRLDQFNAHHAYIHLDFSRKKNSFTRLQSKFLHSFYIAPLQTRFTFVTFSSICSASADAWTTWKGCVTNVMPVVCCMCMILIFNLSNSHSSLAFSSSALFSWVSRSSSPFATSSFLFCFSASNTSNFSWHLSNSKSTKLL